MSALFNIAKSAALLPVLPGFGVSYYVSDFVQYN